MYGSLFNSFEYCLAVPTLSAPAKRGQAAPPDSLITKTPFIISSLSYFEGYYLREKPVIICVHFSNLQEPTVLHIHTTLLKPRQFQFDSSESDTTRDTSLSRQSELWPGPFLIYFSIGFALGLCQIHPLEVEYFRSSDPPKSFSKHDKWCGNTS
eukprot:sb/3473292/